MKKTFSLKESREFQRVLKRGSWYGGDFVSIYILPNNKTFNYLGLAIGKKVGKATKRNRIKRLIKAAYISVEKSLKKGLTIIFVWRAKAKFEDVSYEKIKKDIEKAFKKANILDCDDV